MESNLHQAITRLWRNQEEFQRSLTSLESHLIVFRRVISDLNAGNTQEVTHVVGESKLMGVDWDYYFDLLFVAEDVKAFVNGFFTLGKSELEEKVLRKRILATRTDAEVLRAKIQNIPVTARNEEEAGDKVSEKIKSIQEIVKKCDRALEALDAGDCFKAKNILDGHEEAFEPANIAQLVNNQPPPDGYPEGATIFGG